MLDIKFIRKNVDLVKQGCKNKHIKVDVDMVLELDKKRRKYLKEAEGLRGEENRLSYLISKEIDSTKRDELIEKAQNIKLRAIDYENFLKKIIPEYEKLLLEIPNLPLDDVPVGKDERDNVVLREVGERPKFDFKLKDYLEIAQKLDIIDIKRAAKIAGTRFGFLKRELVLIELALINLAFDTLIKGKFIPILPPIMLKEEMARGTGYFEAADKEEAYFIPKDNLYLAGTSEQPLITMHADEIFKARELPKRYLGFSTCFRREAGSYGKDTKGIFRVHQFDKVEMVSFCQPEHSRKELSFLLKMEEKLMNLLKIPYQVVQICTGDLGRPAAAKYDIEAWLPSENRYRETHSTSNCTHFQARGLNIRYRDKGSKLNFVHTLNGTVFSQRVIIPIIENYQQKDGSIKIPEVLQRYTGFKKINL